MKLRKNECPFEGKTFAYGAVKYALKPTREQEIVLEGICKTLIFMYNALLNYWNDFYKKFKQHPSTAQLEAEIKRVSRLAENKEYYNYVFSQSLQHVRLHLIQAFGDFRRNLSEAKKCKRKIKTKKGKLKWLPKFKSIFRSKLSVAYPQKWSFGNKGKTKLVLPKFLKIKVTDKKGKAKKIPSAIRIIKHCNMKGKPKSIIISKDVNRWYVSIVLEQIVDEKPSLPKKRLVSLDKVGGLDIGVVHLATLDDGEMLESINFDNLYKKVKALQKSFQKQELKKEKIKGKNGEEYIKKTPSNRRKVTVYKFRKLWLKIKNKRKNQAYLYTKRLLQKYDVLFVEDLKIQNMTRSAKGTKEKPGKNVKAKSSLNRNILAKGWGLLFRILEYKFNWANKIFRKVLAKNTSRICSKCGYYHKDNRKTQAHFKCLSCAFELNADLNAAINIRNRGITRYMESQMDRFSLNSLKSGSFQKLAIFKEAV